MSTWSRPYVTILDGAGQPVTWTAPTTGAAAPVSRAGLGLPATGTVKIRWRTPEHPNPRRRTFAAGDPAAAALLADLLAARAAGGVGFRADATGWPRRVPEAPVPRTPPAAPAPPLTQLAPVVGERVIVSPQNRTLREIRDGVLPLGSTVEQVAATLRAQRSWHGAHETNIANILEFVCQVMVYGEPIDDDDEDPDDPAEVAAWKQARLELPGVQVGASLHVALILAPDLEHAIRVRRRTNRRITLLNLQAARRYEGAWDRFHEAERQRAAGVRRGRMPHRPPAELVLRPQPAECEARTEELFATVIGMILTYSAQAGLLVGPNPWHAFASVGPTRTGYRRSSTLRPHQRNVPSVGAVVDLADAVARLGPRDPRTGRPSGERFRALVLAHLSAARSSEIDALRPGDFRDGPRPQLLFARSLVLKHRLAPDDADPRLVDPEPTTVQITNHLKGRLTGEVRQVDLATPVAEALRAHLDAGYASNGLLFTAPEGGVVRWGNLVETYWYPAVQQVFGHSTEAVLRELRRSWLRKAAVTWMLRAGLRPDEVATISGHDVVVLYRHYAAVVDGTSGHHTFTTWDNAWAWAEREHDVY